MGAPGVGSRARCAWCAGRMGASIAGIGLQHANAAPDEMKELADQLRVIMRQAGLPHPASDILYA